MTFAIGLDIGTTSTIGILIEPRTRRVIAQESRPVTLFSERQGWAEEDPREWWDNVCAICRALVSAAGQARIGAIGVTGMVPAVVLLDAEGALLRRSIQQSDGRCEVEVAALARETDATEFLARTGNGINQQLVLAKLRWLATHEPEVFARIATAFGSYDYIAYRLTGARRLERNWALEGGFLDLATRRIAPDLCALGRVAPAILPPLIDPTEVTGRITAQAARETGLPEGVPVTGGVADHVASAYAAGVVSPGQVLLKFGGAGDVLAASDSARPDARLFMDYHPIPGLYMPNGCMASTGSMLNWAARLLAPSEQHPHARLDALAAAVPPGADGLVMLPYMLGEKSVGRGKRQRGLDADCRRCSPDAGSGACRASRFLPWGGVAGGDGHRSGRRSFRRRRFRVARPDVPPRSCAEGAARFGLCPVSRSVQGASPVVPGRVSLTRGVTAAGRTPDPRPRAPCHPPGGSAAPRPRSVPPEARCPATRTV